MSSDFAVDDQTDFDDYQDDEDELEQPLIAKGQRPVDSELLQVLGAAGVWESINSTIQESIGGEDVAGFRIEDYVGTSRVLGFTMLVAAIDVVLITAAATLLAFLYNMSAALLGGVEITLAEDN